MPVCTIYIAIDSAGVAKIRDARLAVTLTRRVDTYVSSTLANMRGASVSASVIWQAFSPYEHNSVVIDDAIFLYMTATTLTAGNVLEINATTNGPARIETLYSFRNGQIDNGNAGIGPAGAYSIRNLQIGASGAFGLAQRATVNGATAISTMNATAVITNTQAAFYLLDWADLFLSSGVNGMIAPFTPTNSLAVPLSGGAVNVGFDNTSNTFYLT
ncbi:MULTISPECIES: hypothetical protein [Burkholderia]|nr:MULTISPECIES: hypothetical protein [Burkholderia]KVG92443.1 hypothetical protein WS82_11390 [Burkholderia sp. MSMB2041]AOJ73140.1 hypothetical protein WS78_21330 [Burkholderia savannae]AOK51107.1 hypothetical protein WT60_23140 [Burkholderia sp. MSMB617WGS]KVG49212.1 hypothetical protein WS77_26420 [Burkholderia sp. MSMB0265]KVG81928.1 hypothetical protein WS81_10925 [Burkholderia sp. MSMB2040]